jgi:hypothetical protein
LILPILIKHIFELLESIFEVIDMKVFGQLVFVEKDEPRSHKKDKYIIISVFIICI